MKLIIKENVAELWHGCKLVARITGPAGTLLDAHVPNADAEVNQIVADGVTVDLEGEFGNIEVDQVEIEKCS